MADNRFDFLEIGDGVEAVVTPHSIPVMPEAQNRERQNKQTDWTAYNPTNERTTIPNAYEDIVLRSQTQDTSIASVLDSTFRAGDTGLRVVEVIGEPGNRAGQFNYPTGIAVDTTGVLFVADSYNHRIQRVTPAADVAVIGSRGSGRGQFLSPMGVATDPQKAFYVVEQGNHRVQKFSANGLPQLLFGKMGTRVGEFRGPSAIAISPVTGHIYIADTGNARVQRFDVDGSYISSLGVLGTTSQPLTSPTGVMVDAHDHVYVTDLKTNRVVKFDPGGRMVGSFIAVRPREGSLSVRALSEPRAIAMDAEGTLYIADGNSSSNGVNSAGRVQLVDPVTGVDIANLEEVGHRLGKLSRPGGLALTKAPVSQLGMVTHSDLFVSDTANHRVLRFAWK